MTGEPLSSLEALAAEYALGTLDAVDRRRAQQLLRRNDAFERLVATWEDHLAPIAETIEPVDPPADLWQRIERELGSPARPASRQRAGLAEPPSLLDRVAFWRWATLGTSVLAAAAAALALYVTLPGEGLAPSHAQRYVAVLGAGENKPALVVTIDPALGRMTIRPVEAEKSEDQALELWLVGGDSPQSLGLLDPRAQTSLDLRPGLGDTVQEGVLAVSLEPPGGSPTGQPTGPVVYQGQVLPLDE